MVQVMVDKEIRDVVTSLDKNALNKHADKLGMPRPTNITETWRLMQILVSEARREQIQIKNDEENGLRIPIEKCGEWIDKIFLIMDNALKRIPLSVENIDDLSEAQKFMVKKEINKVITSVRASIASQEIK